MFKLNSLTGLQLFQLIRYGAFVLIGIGFAKLQIPPSSIGLFETFLLVSGVVSFFWVSGIINSMLSIYPGKETGDKKAVLFNTFISLVGFSLLAGVLLFAFADNLLSFLGKEGGGKIIQLAIVYLLLNNPSFIIEYIFFLNDKKKALLIYGVITCIASVAAALIPVAMNAPIKFSVEGLILVAAARLLFACILLVRYSSFKFDSAILIEHLKISAPVIASIFVSGSAEYVDGIIIKSKFDNDAFAIYRYGAKELPVLFIIANTFSTAMIAPIAANLQDGLSELKRRSARMMHLFFPLTIVLMVVSPFLFPLVFNSNFKPSALIFNIYLLLIIPRLLFPQTILTGIRQTRFLLLSSILEIAINIGASIYLADRFGLWGVAMGTFIAYSFDKVFLLIVNGTVFKIKPSRYIEIKPYLVYVILTFVSFAVSCVILRNY